MTTRNRRSQMRSEALKRIAWHPSAGDSAAHAPLALDIQTVQRTRAATPATNHKWTMWPERLALASLWGAPHI